MSELNPKQQRFCEEYLLDLNGRKAAIRAGYSEHAAKQHACRLLSEPHVRQYLDRLMAERAARTQVSADRVIRELAKIGFSNIQDYLVSGQLVRDIGHIDEAKAAAIASVKVTERETKEATTTTTEFKLHDKIAALTRLGDHLGIWYPKTGIDAAARQEPQPAFDLSKLSDEELSTLIELQSKSGAGPQEDA